MLTTWNVGSENVGEIEFTTIYPTADNGAGSNISVFWGGDFPGFPDTYFFYDANGGTGGFSVDLGTNRFIKFIGSTGDDIVRNQTGDKGGTAVELTAYGHGGNDEFYGGQEYDKLIGGPGTDKLFGGAGDDVLYGGLASDNDELVGGTGEDRFYVRSTELNLQLGVATVLDKHNLDSRVHLVDTPNGFSWGSTSYNPNTWSDSAFEAIDKPFGILHDTTQSERLMQTSSGGDIYQFALGTVKSGGSIGAWSNGDDEDYYEQEYLTGKAIVHEIAHHFHSPAQNPLNAAFRAISGWTQTEPASSLSFADWIKNYPNGNYNGFVQSRQVGANWWFEPKGLAREALFSWEYGGQNPREDFSVTAEAWYQWSIDKVTTHPLITSKQNNLNEFFNYMATPTLPTDLKIDQSGNVYRPKFSWESMVADSFRVQIKNSANVVVVDLNTAELSMEVASALPAGKYTFLVNSQTTAPVVAQSPQASLSFTVNNAPQWTPGVNPPPMAAQNEDDRLAIGTTIASLVAAQADVDPDALKGIAVFSAPTDKGKWQYTISGSNGWVNLSATTRDNARLLPAKGNLSRIRFVPNQDFNGSVSLGYYAWDQTQGTPGGVYNISTDDKLGGLTAFSNGVHYADLTVSPVNDAPVWKAGVQPPALNTILEDDRTSYGTTIAFLTSALTDVDIPAVKGIAIVTNTRRDMGEWQYTINGGTNWVPLGSIGLTNARLLPANGTQSRIRFVPQQDFNGSVQLGYFGWDQTQATAGGGFDISTADKTGGTTAFSTGTHYAALTVTSVNDSPVWATSVPPAMKSIFEGDLASYGTTIASMTEKVSDGDDDAKKGIAIFDASGLYFGYWQFTLNGGTTWNTFASGNFPRSRSKAMLLPSDGVLSRVRFVPKVDFNGTVTIGYYAWDQTQGSPGGNFDVSTNNKIGGSTAFSGGSHGSPLIVKPVNDAPEWTPGVGTFVLPQLKEDETNSAGTTVESLAAGIADVDGPKKGIAVFLAETSQRSTGADRSRWQYTLNGGHNWYEIASILTPTGRSNAVMLPANGTYSRIRFVPHKNWYGDMKIGYLAWDQTQGLAGDRWDTTGSRVGGATAFSTGIHYASQNVSAENDAPAWGISAVFPPLQTITEDNLTSSGTAIASITKDVSDPDVGAVKGIAIFKAPNDKGKWQFTLNGGSTWSNISSASLTGAKLLPANGEMSRVRFVPVKDFNGTVELGYYAWDQTKGTAGNTADISTQEKRGGTTAFSNVVHFSTLAVTPVSDPPVLSGVPGSVVYTVGKPSISLAPSAEISDIDSSYISSLRIGGSLHGLDRLSFIGGVTVERDEKTITRNGSRIGYIYSVGNTKYDGQDGRALHVMFDSQKGTLDLVRRMISWVHFSTGKYSPSRGWSFSALDRTLDITIGNDSRGVATQTVVVKVKK